MSKNSFNFDNNILYQQLLDALEESGDKGLTWIECAWVDMETRHGSVSGALSRLHEFGFISRLAKERDGRSIYISNNYVKNKETQERTRHVTRKYLIELLIDLKTHFHYGNPEKALARIDEELKEWVPKDKKK